MEDGDEHGSPLVAFGHESPLVKYIRTNISAPGMAFYLMENLGEP